MYSKKTDAIILGLLVLLFLLINYSFLDNKLEDFLNAGKTEDVFITRVIDGDTIEAKDKNESIRLLGINTPERGEPYYSEAKEFLEDMILNKTVKLEYGKERYDIYKRTLAYVFLDEGEESVNLEIVKNGLANYYFPKGKDKYYNDFKDAWNFCINSEKNLCKKSENVCASCVELKAFDYIRDEIVFYNKCSFSCNLTNWKIKDSGRKTFVFPKFSLSSDSEVLIKVGDGKNTGNVLFWRGEEYVWTPEGDVLFLRDGAGDLVLWKSY